MSVSLYGYVHMSAGAHRGQKRALDLLKLELQAIACCLSGWSELNYSASVVNILTAELHLQPQDARWIGQRNEDLDGG